MIQSLTFTNRFGRSLHCILGEPERSGFAITGISGLGPGRASVNVHDIATADGGYFGTARFSSRDILIQFTLLDFDINGSYNPIEDVRHLSYEFFPPKTKIKIVVETDRRSLTIDGYVEENTPNIFESSVTVTVSIRCPGYYFKMVSDTGSVQDTMIYGSGLFQFPFSNESLVQKLIEFGNIDIDQKYMMYYDGDAESGFELEIVFSGDVVTSFSIQNNPVGNSDKGPVGFRTSQDAGSIAYRWSDQDIVSKYISLNLATVASKLANVYPNPIYGVGNSIIISSLTGKKSAFFIDANDNRYNILDAFDHLDWLKVYPGYNEFEIVTNAASVGHFTASVRYEALYTGV